MLYVHVMKKMERYELLTYLTTAAVGNIENNPSSTTTTGSFYGTSISLIPHPRTTEEGHDMGKIIFRDSSPKKCINTLPASYSNVPTVVSKSGKPTVSPVSESMMVRNQSTISTDAISSEVEWLENINKIYKAGKTETETRNVNASIVGENKIKPISEIKQLKLFRGLRFMLRDRRR